MAQHNTAQPPQLVSTDTAWLTFPAFTVGETIDGYTPPGILDGIGAQRVGEDVVRLYVNHELTAPDGYAYTLDNGTVLTGARISYLDFNRRSFELLGSRLAYDAIVDRYGEVVTSALQINEGDAGPTDGLDRLCSGSFFPAGRYGLVDDLYFAGEEVSDNRGGQEFVLDTDEGVLYAAPWLGRAAWENVTLVDTGNPRVVAFVIGDDRVGAPLYLYVGYKNAVGDGSLLDRNGLAQGRLLAWVSDNGDQTPEDFNGTGSSRQGHFQLFRHYDARLADTPGYDAAGFADQVTIDSLTAALGHFEFSRPEDVATNPEDGTQVLFASTGRGSTYPSDDWGTTYLLDIDFEGRTGASEMRSIPASLTILYDGDDGGNGQFPDPDFGLRSPDNLDWAHDGYGYVQEDRSTSLATFGGVSGEEASVWQLDPATGLLDRIAQINRSAVPEGQVDTAPDDLGNWESSGIVDVTAQFGLPSSFTLLAADVQAHSLEGAVLDSLNLVEGGQLLFLLGIPSASSMRAALEEAGSLAEAIRVLEGGEEPQAASEAGVPTAFTLEAASPNPFTSATTLTYATPEPGPVRLAVYDALGREVAVLADGAVEAGRHAVVLDGRPLPSGVYLVRLVTPEGVQTHRVTRVK